MKFLIVAACALSCVYADSADVAAETLKSSYDLTPEGGYQYAVETSNGIAIQQQGVPKPSGTAGETVLTVSGASSYKSPEGEAVSITYVADENGYQPQGSHLPVPPEPLPIPEHIQRALKYIAEHPYQEKKV